MVRRVQLFIARLFFVAVAVSAVEARADSMDPALGRLVLDNRCQATSNGVGTFSNPAAGFNRCQPNHAAFAKLVSQLGTAIAPLASHPARTTGYGGYRFGLQMAYTTIDNSADYWRRGTQGGTDESQGLSSTINGSPDSVLQLYSLNLAKGFPFGLELGAGFGYLANTEIISGGGDVRLALFEGFRGKIPRFIPDVGVGGGVRTITGTSELKLTVASFDAQISKPIPILGTVTLHPHVGYQWIRIFGDSGTVDLTPNNDSVTKCGYSGENTPATPDPNKDGFDGQPNCLNSSADFNNNIVFNPIRLTRHRINFGTQLRYQFLQFGIHLVTDVIDPVDANNDQSSAIDPEDPSGQTRFELNRLADDPRTEGDDAVTRQWTVAVEIGAAF